MKIFLLACVLCAHALAKKESLLLSQTHITGGSKSMNQLDNVLHHEEDEEVSVLSATEKAYADNRAAAMSEISNLEDQSDQLEADHARASGNCERAKQAASSADGKAADAAAARSAAEADLEAATKRKNAANDHANANIAEFARTIETMEKVKEQLSATGFIQTNMDLSALHPADRVKFEAFLQGDNSDATENIVKMVDGIQQATEKNLFDAKTTKVQTIADIQMQMQTSQNEANNAAAMQKRQKANAGNQRQIAADECQAASDVSGEIDATQTQLNEVQANLAVLTKEFAASSEKSKKFIETLDNAEAELEDGGVAHGQAKRMHAADQAKDFIQMSSVNSEVRQHIASMLQQRANHINSKRLQSASMLIALGAGDPLSGVRKVIADKISELESEADEEAKQHASCKALKKTLGNDADHWSSQVAKFQADADQADGRVNRDTTSLEKSQESEASALQTQKIAVEENSSLGEKLQARVDEAKTHESDLSTAKGHLEKGDAPGSLIGLVDGLIKDIANKREANEAAKSEGDANVEELKKQTVVAVQAAKTQIRLKTQAIANHNKKKSAAQSNKANAIVEQVSVSTRKQQYQNECVNTAESHEERMAKLRDEQSALKDARELLRDAEKDVNA